MEYFIHLAIIACLYGMIGLSLNLLVGETGLVSVTSAAFVGIGAYTTALLMTHAGMSFFLALLFAILLASAIAFLVGVIFLPLKEVYYVFGTIGFNVIAWSVFLNWRSLTGGSLGVPGIPRPSIFGYTFSENSAYLLLAIAGLGCVYAIYRFIVRSSFGRVLHAIREDEKATAVFGYSTTHYKLLVFTVSSACAALAGGIFASYIAYINPQGFLVTESVFVLAIVILGGLGSAEGAVLGAFLLVVLPELLRFVGFPPDTAAQLRQVCYGLILIFFMLYRPQGILGKFRI